MVGLRRGILAALCVASLSGPPGRARAGMVNLTYAAPTAAGTVSTFVTDLNGDTVDVKTAIAANLTATQKRDAILASLNAAVKPAGFGFAAAGAASITFSYTGNLSIVVNSNPRGTGEGVDRVVVQGVNNGSFKGGHGTMDPHAPTMSLFTPGGAAASFTAGIQIGAIDYAVTLLGSDSVFGGATTATGATIATDLYNRLVALGVPGVTFSLVTGNTRGYAGDLAIAADFVPGASDEGLIFGTTSLVADDPVNEFGFLGSLALTPVPEPSSLLMLGLGGLAVTLAARRRARAV